MYKNIKQSPSAKRGERGSKHSLLRLLVAMSIIAFATSMLAVSCGKTADPNTNTNNNANNSGGDGGGGDGGGGTPKPPCTGFCPTGLDATWVKVSQETNILIRANGFPPGNISGDLENAVNGASTDIKKAFEFTHDSAMEGIVLVGKGNVPNAGAITTSAPVAAYPAGATGNDGIHIVRAAAAANNLPAGLNFFSAFANTTNPTTVAEAAANVEPFAFSKRTVVIGGVGTRQPGPFFYCVATAPAITAAVAATDRLTGAHKTSCFVGSTDTSFDSVAENYPWFTVAQPFKREIQVAVVAIKTDGKTIATLGLPGADAAARLANFNDGIDATEMAAIVAANGTPLFKRFNIKVLNNAQFAAAP